MDLTTLKAVVAELQLALLPSRFEKAQQGESHGLQLALRSLDGYTWLDLSWLAEAPRLLAIPSPARQGEGSTLAQQLQHGLRGLALVSLEQMGWERVVELGFAQRPGETIQRSLVLELMGRHSNLFFLDEQRRVIALARQVRPDQSRLRPIGTGDAYRPPPSMAGEPPRAQESRESWRRRLSLVPVSLKRALLGAYQGTSPALVRQLLPPGWAERPVQELEECQWQLLWQAWQGWLAALEEGCFALQLEPGGAYRCWSPPGTGERLVPVPPASTTGSPDPLAINRGLARYYGLRLSQRLGEQRRQSLALRLRQAIERERRQAEQQQALADAVPGSEGLQHQADALLCLPNPDRSQIDEAQALYRKARKLRRSLAAILPRLEQHQQRLEGLETSLTFVEQLEDGAQLQALTEELEQQLSGLRPSRGGSVATSRSRRHRAGSRGRPAPVAEPCPLELRSAGGLRLQVGRNHRQNEWIALRHARRGDLWFHAQELPGSHVVLKGSEGAAGEADLAAAADLAAHFSRGRGNARVPVVMVAAETLQRIPGAEPGTVRHRGGEILWGEPERAQALLRSQPGPEAAAEP
jgi:predicted ribosome quality control (RQC) complex YloA/Tae2 family protein